MKLKVFSPILSIILLSLFLSCVQEEVLAPLKGSAWEKKFPYSVLYLDFLKEDPSNPDGFSLCASSERAYYLNTTVLIYRKRQADNCHDSSFITAHLSSDSETFWVLNSSNDTNLLTNLAEVSFNNGELWIVVNIDFPTGKNHKDVIPVPLYGHSTIIRQLEPIKPILDALKTNHPNIATEIAKIQCQIAENMKAENQDICAIHRSFSGDGGGTTPSTPQNSLFSPSAGHYNGGGYAGSPSHGLHWH